MRFGGELRVVAFNFSSQFVAAVASGKKTQTVRKTKRAKKGDTLQLLTGQRTRACREIKTARCVCVDYVHIAPDGLTFGNKDNHPESPHDFARLDGFKDYDDMLAWFKARYGTDHFVGYVYRWQ